MDIISNIRQSVFSSLNDLGCSVDFNQIIVDSPSDRKNGDYSCNIAMIMASKLKANPRDLAKKIIDSISSSEDIEKIEVAGPGFINFYVSDKYLLKYLADVVDKGEKGFQLNAKAGKNIVIEYTDPNPFKILHIGHLYTNCVGESFARLQEALGANVKRVNYQGDIGLHVAKTLWGFEKKMKDEGLNFEDIEKMVLVDRVSYLGDSYILGTNYYDNLKDADAVETINDLNYYLSSLVIDSLKRKDFSKFEDLGIKEKYIKGRQWCLDYFETIYKRLGTKFDYYFFESEVGKAGLKVVLDNVGGIFEEDDGAIVYRGDESKGLHTRVFVNKYGVPTYEAKELGLFLAKAEKINYDESVVITANEQSGYFKVVLDALSRVDSRLANVSRHMPHGMIRLPGSEKMSSRKGNILSGEWLLNETKSKVKSLMLKNSRSYSEDIDSISEKIAIASIKYAFLKVSVGRDVDFDFEEAISFDGNTGPYLLYVYARCNSLVSESSITPSGVLCLGSCVDNAYLRELLAKISNYKSSVLDSGLDYSPSTLIQYLFELGKIFNNFYQNVRVLDAAEEEKQLLINVIYATMYTIKDGLKNLGIDVVEEM